MEPHSSSSLDPLPESKVAPSSDQWWVRDGLALGLLGLALGLYYFPANPWLSLLGGMGFLLGAWRRLDLALLWALWVVPFYRFPKVFLPQEVGLSFWRGEALEFSLFEFAVLAGGVAWAGRWLTRRQGSPRLDTKWWASPALLLLLAAILSMVTSQHPRYSLRALRVVILEPLLFYFLLNQVVISIGAWRRYLYAFLALEVVVAGVALFHYFFIGVVEEVEGVRRLLAIYHSPNALALFLGRGLPMALALSLFGGKETGLPRALWIGASLLLGVGLFFTYSRGAWLGVGLAALFLVWRRWGWRWLGAAAGLMALGLVLSLWLLPGRLASEASSSQRLYLWQAAGTMALDHPLLGVGPDNFLYHYPSYQLPQAWAEPAISHPHNLVLDFWLSTGVLGLVALAWLQRRFWRGGGQLWKQERFRPQALALMASMVDFLGHGLIDNSFFLIDLAVVFWLTYSLMMAGARLSKEER